MRALLTCISTSSRNTPQDSSRQLAMYISWWKHAIDSHFVLYASHIALLLSELFPAKYSYQQPAASLPKARRARVGVKDI